MEIAKSLTTLHISYKNSYEKILPLDGLRGLAVLLVVFFHCFDYLKISYFGWMGVDLFFVLSGFLISGILIDVKSDPNYFKNFFGKRVLRIFPLYYLVLLIFTIIAAFNIIKADYEINFPNLYQWLYVQNWKVTFNGKFTDENPLLNHFWSLAVEEQFYIFWPLIVKKSKLKFLVYIILAFIVLAIGLRVFFVINNSVGYYVNTFSRLDALCIGSLVAVLIRTNQNILKKYTVFVFVLSGLFILINAIISGPFFSHDVMAKFGLTIVAFFWASLLLFSISNKGILSKIFSAKILRFFGKYSYGLYVYHNILYIMLVTPALKYLNTFEISGLGINITVSIVIVLISILISMLSFNLYEKRFTKYRKYFHSSSSQ